jgi:hypothetical protein
MPKLMRINVYVAAPLACWFVTLALAAVAESPGRLHMFLDDAMIESSQDTKLVVQQPTRLGHPIVTGVFPWQANPYTYGSVIYDEADHVYKAWYESVNPLPKPEATAVLYATSNDGRNWEYPKLGLVDFKGSKDNNVLFLGAGFSHICSPSVIKDDRDPDPNRRRFISGGIPNRCHTCGRGRFKSRWVLKPIHCSLQIPDAFSDAAHWRAGCAYGEPDA